MSKHLTQKQVIGQKIFAGFPSTIMSDEFIQLVKKYKISNVILFKNNIENRQQVQKLCSDIQKLVTEETGYPAFIAIDQEGGMVTRLSEDSINVPGAMAIAATGKPEYAYKAGLMTAQELRYLGINFNLAPCMDINSNPKNPVIGVRSYGDKAETVITYASKMQEGLNDGNVLSCAKHFPGHGDVSIDSHLSLPYIDKSYQELEKLELVPFIHAIKTGIPAIMSSHILFSQIEEKYIPATMSRTIITGLLKEKLQFKGLVLSDCMEMNAIKGYFGTVEGVVSAIKAGIDLVFISHTAQLVEQAAERLYTELEKETINSDEMYESVKKILMYKEIYAKELSNKENFSEAYNNLFEKNKIESQKILEESICCVQTPSKGQADIGSNPFFVGCPPFVTTLASNPLIKTLSFAPYMQKLLGGRAFENSIEPQQDEINSIVLQAKNHSCIIVGTYNGHLKPGQINMVQALSKINIPIIAVALRNPYDLQTIDKSVYALALFEYTPQSLNTLALILQKKLKPRGKLPIQFNLSHNIIFKET